jgi:hypothetical protein
LKCSSNLQAITIWLFTYLITTCLSLYVVPKSDEVSLPFLASKTFDDSIHGWVLAQP